MAAATLLICGASAQAVGEIEPNNTLGTPQTPRVQVAPFVVTGSRLFADPSDDFFSFQVQAAGLLRIVSGSNNSSADSIMGLFSGASSLLASNDDAPGSGFMSTIEFALPAAGTYVLGFSGYNPGLLACSGVVTACYDTNGDFIFDTFVAGGGAGGSAGWDHTLSFSGAALVPEPHATLLFLPALALLLMRARRV